MNGFSFLLLVSRRTYVYEKFVYILVFLHSDCILKIIGEFKLGKLLHFLQLLMQIVTVSARQKYFFYSFFSNFVSFVIVRHRLFFYPNFGSIAL